MKTQPLSVLTILILQCIDFLHMNKLSNKICELVFRFTKNDPSKTTIVIMEPNYVFSCTN